jgi:hypothetical protein
MHGLSVGALFKNEAHCIKEFILHYLYHGVEHLYLINDASTDAFLPLIQPFIDRGVLTLFHSNHGYYLGRQHDLYNHFFLPRLKESEWFLVVDMDEFVWSPNSIDLKKILAQCTRYGQIQVEHTIFGSNDHVLQPESVVRHFTRRAEELVSFLPDGNRKYFINTGAFEFVGLNCHHAWFKEDAYHTDASVFVCLGPEYFRLNHYMCQSFEFWKNVKCVRGDADHYKTRRVEDFPLYDLSEVDDTTLAEQNEPIQL